MSRDEQTEPSADIRDLASAMWQLYVAFMREGFTAQQAMTLVVAQISGAASAGGRSS